MSTLSSDLPSDLATPFEAAEYFATYIPATAPSGPTTTAPAVTCNHVASPRHTCAAIAEIDGWCDCGDDIEYQEMTEPGSICEWTTLPPTKSFDCPAAATTAPPPATTTAAPPEPEFTSPACENCMSAMGASDCPADDTRCLIDECNDNEDCQACTDYCSVAGSEWLAEG